MKRFSQVKNKITFSDIITSAFVNSLLEIMKNFLRHICRQFLGAIGFSSHNKLLRNIGKQNNSFFRAKIKRVEKCDFYPVEKGTKLLLIFNYNKIKGMKERLGSYQDVENLKRVFEEINFKVKDFIDYTKEDTEKVLEYYRTSPELEETSAFFMIFMSHGDGKDPESFSSSDAQSINLANLRMRFNDLNCSLLAGKPKVLVAVCCRAIEEKIDISTPTDNENKNQCQDTLIQSEYQVIRETSNIPRPWAVDGKTIPCTSSLCNEKDCNDWMVIYACARGKISYRDPKYGSLFVQAFCKTIKKHSHELDMYGIVSETQREMKKEIPPDATPLEGFEASMSPLTFRRLYLMPPHHN